MRLGSALNLRLAPLLVSLLALISACSAFTLAPETQAPTQQPAVLIPCNVSLNEPFPCKNSTFIASADVPLSGPVTMLGSLSIAGLTKLTVSTAQAKFDLPIMTIKGQLQVTAPLLIVLPVSDIASTVQLLEFDSLSLSGNVGEDWLRLDLLLPQCGSVKSISLKVNETHAWAVIKGVSCARAERAREMAVFIGLGAGCGALVILIMALRVSQWTYLVYDTSETVRRGYEKVRLYVPLPEGPAPVTEEFLRDIIREEHEDELE